jgi:hypothetical protein
MTLPFSRSEFFAVFARYNDAVWPAQLVLYALAIAVVILILRRSSTAARGTLLSLAALWLWMGVVYHAGFFASVNPAAIGFAAAFVVQAVLFLRLAVRGKVMVKLRNDPAGWAGGALVILGLIVYPLMSVAAGHRYPAQPTFGLPCPTTIFTLGLMSWMLGSVPRHLFVIPVLWAITGSIAALELGVTEDLSLAAALLMTCTVWVARQRAHGVKSAAPNSSVAASQS